MKRIRIWLKSFNLLQQLLAIVFISFAFFILFGFSFLNNNINNFINNQMYTSIHRYQSQYISGYEQSNDMLNNYVYSIDANRYLNNVDSTYKSVLENIDLSAYQSDTLDGIYKDDATYVYSITSFEDKFLLVTIAKPEFRSEVESALINGVVSITVYVMMGIILLIMIWVSTLIRPINQMKNYVTNIKLNKDEKLNIDRGDEIGGLAEAIVDMNQELSQQKHIRDEMIQNISHDLKTPIATIKSYSESIKDGIYPYDTLEKSVDVIIDNANRLEKKVYSLLTYNKMEYLKNNQPSLLTLKMAPVIEKAILGEKMVRNEIKIETNLDENVYFCGDEEPWRVVVENLLDNCLRYAKSVVRINLEDNLLEVYNDGSQIEEDRLDKLFTAYEMGNKGKFGLGLSIVKKVSETYGYSVTGENMNDGVIFRIFANKKMKRPSKRALKKENKDE